MRGSISIQEAIRQGQKSIYGWGKVPILVDAVLFFVLFYLRSKYPGPLVETLAVVSAAAFVPAWVFMWLWWSVQTPKWKLWAYARVDDVNALKIVAISAGLIWPDNHIFEKTEICSKAMRQQILKLEGRA